MMSKPLSIYFIIKMLEDMRYERAADMIIDWETISHLPVFLTKQKTIKENAYTLSHILCPSQVH